MLQVLLSVVIAFIILLVTEKLSTRKFLGPEVSRKMAHIAIGIAIATWPFFVSMHAIAALGAIFVIATLLVRQFNLFPGARTVGRLSWGEPFFALSVSIIALADPSKWIFVAAVLYLAIADAAAALVGNKWGKNKYTLFGHSKSLEGTLAFILTAIVITAWVVLIAPAGLSNNVPVILLLPILAAGVEASMPWGLDNLLLPILVTTVLSSLQVVA